MVQPAQLVTFDLGGPVDPTTSLCNNSNAPVAGCVGYQGRFAAAQFYTQPAVAYGTVAVSGNILYAVPFFSPANGGTITQLGLDVIAPGTVSPASLCTVGVYNASNQAPTSRIANGGTLSVGSAGTPTNTGLVIPLAPSTLYFLAVGCNGSVSLEGVVAGGGLSTPLVGAPDFVTTSTVLSASWTFSATLPTTFGTVTRVAGSVPNVFAGP
jgi:hypothetical protein